MMVQDGVRDSVSSPSADVRNLDEAMAIMETIDWTFSSRATAARGDLLDARKYHWYPATFIPELPYTLVEILTLPGASVYDPFSGIGTTAFQAAALGRWPFGTEICRVAVQMARSLWVLVRVGSDESWLSMLSEKVRAFNPTIDYRQEVNVDDLAPWYARETLNEIAYLKKIHSEGTEPATEAAGKLALSATLNAVCAQDRGWGCIADNVLPKPEQRLKQRSALDRFMRNLRVVDRDVSRFRRNLAPSGLRVFEARDPTEVVVHADARSAAAEEVDRESIDLVLTSPPYPEMTDYCTAQRLSYYSLGSDPADDLRNEVGARRRRFRKSSLEEYREDMKAVAKGLWQCLKPGGYVCLVMPHFSGGTSNHVRRGEVVGQSLEEFEKLGLTKVGTWRRLLPSRRRHHNQKWTSLTEEAILLFRKE